MIIIGVQFTQIVISAYQSNKMVEESIRFHNDILLLSLSVCSEFYT